MKKFRVRAYGRSGARICHMFCAEPWRVGKTVEQLCDLTLAGGDTVLLILDQVKMKVTALGLAVTSESARGDIADDV
jgi:hypothetical protein